MRCGARALDAAVAKHLFGLEVETRVNTRTGRRVAVCRQPGKQWVRVGYYSGSTGASLNVAYELRRQGWTWRREVRTVSKWSQPGVQRVVLEHTDGRTVEAEGASIHEALCRAALKAVM